MATRLGLGGYPASGAGGPVTQNVAVSESIALVDTVSAASAEHVTVSESAALADTVSAALHANASIAELMHLQDAVEATRSAILNPPLILRDDYIYSGNRNLFDPKDAIFKLDLNLDKLRKFPGKN